MGIFRFFVDRPLLVKVSLLGVVLLSLLSIRKMQRDSFPQVDLGTMVITTKYLGASPKDVEENVTRLIEDELKGGTGIQTLRSTSTQNVSTVVVEIDIDYPDQEEVKNEIRRAVERVTELPPEVEVAKPGPPIGKPIELKVQSDVRELREDLTKKVMDYLASVEGVYDIASDAKLGREEYKVDLNFRNRS